MKQKIVIGDIVEIKLPDNEYCFARVLNEPLISFYNIKSKSTKDINYIVDKEVIFKIWVMNNAITSGRWKVIGNIPLSDTEKKPVTFFNQDPISKNIYSITNGVEKSISKEDASSLERAAVWNPEHVEERLIDHFNKKNNKWVESLKAK